MTADFMLFLLQNEEMKKNSEIVCKVTKNRFNGRTDTWEMSIDYPHMRFNDMLEQSSGEAVFKQAENEKNELKLNLINAQKELLEHTNKQIEARRKTLKISETELKESDIYKKFHLSNGNSKLKEEDWNTLSEMIDKIYSRFTARLYALHPFNEKEIRICLLIKINLKPSQIAPLIPCAKQTLTSIRKKMYEKTHNQKGSPELWDEFIRNF